MNRGNYDYIWRASDWPLSLPCYDILERTQKASLDVTEWLLWFIATLHRAVDQAQLTLDVVMFKALFWQRWAGSGGASLNERQVKLLNRLLDGFQGKLTSRKWAAIAHCSPDTAPLRPPHPQ